MLENDAFAHGGRLTIVNTSATNSPSTHMTGDPSETPKRNWPLIWTIVIAGALTTTVVVGSIALYVANFNLLEWME